MVVPDALDDLEEFLGVTVGDVEADEPYPRALRHDRELLQIGRRRPQGVEGVRAVRPVEETNEFLLGIVLVKSGQRPMFTERPGHLHRPGHVHVGGDERKTLPLRSRVDEPERPADVDGGAGVEGGALGPDQNVLEIQLDVGFDAHGRSKCRGEGGRRLFVIDLSQTPGEAYRAGRKGRGAERERMSDELVFYTHPMSRARLVRWMLEEVGQPYETKILEFGHSMRSPEYLAINPMGKVPAIRHGETVVTEAAAICAYLADAFPAAGLAPPPGSRERGPLLSLALLRRRLAWSPR